MKTLCQKLILFIFTSCFSLFLFATCFSSNIMAESFLQHKLEQAIETIPDKNKKSDCTAKSEPDLFKLFNTAISSGNDRILQKQLASKREFFLDILSKMKDTPKLINESKVASMLQTMAKRPDEYQDYINETKKNISLSLNELRHMIDNYNVVFNELKLVDINTTNFNEKSGGGLADSNGTLTAIFKKGRHYYRLTIYDVMIKNGCYATYPQSDSAFYFTKM